MKAMRKTKAKQMTGYGLVEYLLGVAMLVGILFVPIGNNTSLSDTLIDAVKQEHAAYIYVASMANTPNVSVFTGSQQNTVSQQNTNLQKNNK